jgi:hypothetical protein
MNCLAPAGAAMAMLACYGMTAAIGVLSLIGMSVALQSFAIGRQTGE